MDIGNGVNLQAVGGDQFLEAAGQGMDLQSLIMAIESRRADLLDQQLADQTNRMKDLNAKIAQANKIVAKARQAREEIQATKNMIQTLKDYKARNWAIGKSWETGKFDSFHEWFKTRGIEMDVYVRGVISEGDPGAYDRNIQKLEKHLQDVAGPIKNLLTDNGIQFDATNMDNNIQSIKGYVDWLNSTSQMEMIRLQSLMNKRNQAYELMTNALQKLSGSLDKIIANVR